MYSPTTPSPMRTQPLQNQMDSMSEAQPVTVFCPMRHTTTHTAMPVAIIKKITPNQRTMCKRLIEKLVMPFIARPIILDRGYLLSPA